MYSKCLLENIVSNLSNVPGPNLKVIQLQRVDEKDGKPFAGEWVFCLGKVRLLRIHCGCVTAEVTACLQQVDSEFLYRWG